MTTYLTIPLQDKKQFARLPLMHASSKVICLCYCQSNQAFDWCEATDTLVVYVPSSEMYVHVCIWTCVCVSV